MKRSIAVFLAFLLIFAFCACGEETPFEGTVVIDTAPYISDAPSGEVGQTGAPVQESVFETAGDVSEVDGIITGFLTQAQETLSTPPEVKEDGVRLLGDSVEYNGEGITVEGTRINVTEAGTYSFSGTLNDGQIVVNAEKTDKVTLVLNGASINCTSSAPIYIMSCDKATLTLADGTVNRLTDGTEYTYDVTGENEPNAALFSKDDLTIDGNGSLVVNANYNNGITSKNDLKIKSGTVTVVSKHDGIRGKDSVCIDGGTVNIQSGGDGIKSSNDTETDKGHVTVENGTFNISASEDGIQAQTTLTVQGGSFLIKTGAGSGNSWSGSAYGNASEASAKALKAEGSIVVTGGAFSIDSADDSVHSNGTVAITGGNLDASSGDDGIHADEKLEISGGVINIKKSYEGLESVTINIKGGNIHVKASDDGINGAGGNDGSGMGGGRPGAWGGMGGASNAAVTVSGGYTYIDAGGDGLDSNGSFTMTDGTVIVDGPTSNGNGPLDYTTSFNISGGLLIAAGSSGMAQNVSSTSTQCAVLVYTSGSGGTVFNISSSEGKNIVTYKPSKQYSCVLVSSPLLEKGVTYTVATGGTCTGDSTDGLYTSGTYSGGITAQTYTQSSVVTSAGSGGGMGGGMGGGGMRPGRPGRW